MSAQPKLVTVLLALLAAAVGVSACGTQGIQVAKSSRYYNGAALFLEHCSGCHTLATVGAEGSATSIKDRLRTNGPNFDFRKEQYSQVMFAIRNGGFSGAIMPQNIVVGSQAREVAEFLAKYSGLQAPKVPVIESTSSEGTSTATSTAGEAKPGTTVGGASNATGASASAAAGGASANAAAGTRGKTSTKHAAK